MTMKLERLLPIRAERELIPRFDQQGYSEDEVTARRCWIEERTTTRLAAVAGAPLPTRTWRGNIENPIGEARMPLGVAGPLKIVGEAANGLFFVPLATTEGALVRSYERGMVAATRAGGITTRVLADENRVSPIFRFDDVGAAAAFVALLPDHFAALKAAAEATTRHGFLLRIEPQLLGRKVIVHFVYSTGDAHGMNMIVKATDAACRMLDVPFFIFSGAEGEKRAAGTLFGGGKGKKVSAGVRLPARVVRTYLHTSANEMATFWRHTVIGHIQGATFGYNGHFANGLAALFIACGQDVANVVNAAVGLTTFEEMPGGELYASVTLPALTVATVGGGTGLGTGRECLEMLGCAGSGQARKFAEIVAATLLAGELSMGAALASGEFVTAHETYGRNRPQAESSELPEDRA